MLVPAIHRQTGAMEVVNGEVRTQVTAGNGGLSRTLASRRRLSVNRVLKIGASFGIERRRVPDHDVWSHCNALLWGSGHC